MNDWLLDGDTIVASGILLRDHYRRPAGDVVNAALSRTRMRLKPSDSVARLPTIREEKDEELAKTLRGLHD